MHHMDVVSEVGVGVSWRFKSTYQLAFLVRYASCPRGRYCVRGPTTGNRDDPDTESPILAASRLNGRRADDRLIHRTLVLEAAFGQIGQYRRPESHARGGYPLALPPSLPFVISYLAPNLV